MKRFCPLKGFIFSMLIALILMAIPLTTQAASTTIPGSSISVLGMSYDSSTNRYGASAYYETYGDDYIFIRPTITFSGNCSLPANTSVTSAYFYIYGGINVHNHFAYEYNPATFMGHAFYSGRFAGSCNTWWPAGSGQQYIPSFYTFNVTPYFSSTSQGFSFSSQLNATDYDYAGFNYEAGASYIVINYVYVPSTPIISSPVAGSNNKTTVSLSASSTCTENPTITYNWQYSLDGLTNWQTIASSTTAYNWTIPTSIPINSSIYVRASATANGQTSAYSSVVRFNNADDPAVSAKLAAESAEAKAEEARQATDKVLQLVSRPTLCVYLANGATLTTNALTVVDMVYSNDAGTLEGMEYSYRRAGQGWSDWAALPDSGQGQATVPITAGFNRIEFCVRNELGIVSRPIIFSIWGLV